MSVDRGQRERHRERERAGLRTAVVDRAGFRLPALAAVATLTATYTSVLYHVTDVVGGSSTFVPLVVGTLVFATGLGRFLRLRSAFVFSVVLLGGGLAAYFLSLPASQLALLSAERLLSDTVALLTGLSVLRLTAADVWSLAITPGPVFLSWYLAVRRQYVGSVVAGGSALCLFVLTGDAGTATTLVGVVAAAAAVGFGTLDCHGGTTAQVDVLVAVFAAMVVLASLVSVVPGGATQPLLPDRGSPTVEASLVNTDDRVEILGSIRLSPNVRFTVESDEPAYWQTTAFDRYTGDGWVRTGGTDPYTGRLAGPPGRARTVEQTYTTETRLSVVPAAWRPVAVDDPLSATARVSPQGSLEPGTALSEGETYTVESRVPQYTTARLRAAGDDYPDSVQQYLQLPDSTSQRVRERAAAVAGDEDTAYDTAVAIESYLESEKRYSLSVERPSGDVAEAFLFEMDAGYCTYYATTMVVMLRAEGVPARFVTGYTPGEQVGDGEYVVRGLNSHAWVQVYFPDVGWVQFDPTPGTPRERAENTRLTEARQSGAAGVDTAASEPSAGTTTPEQSSDVTPNGAATETPAQESLAEGLGAATPETPAAAPGASAATDEGVDLPELPSRRTLLLSAVAFAGVVAGARRVGVTGRLYRGVWLRYQRTRETPERDVERAFARLEYLLGQQHRPREPGETPRAYLTAIRRATATDDDRLRRVRRAYERARYGDGVTRAEAEATIETVNALVRERSVLGRLRDRGTHDR